jgi:hypothetical protein
LPSTSRNNNSRQLQLAREIYQEYEDNLQEKRTDQMITAATATPISTLTASEALKQEEDKKRQQQQQQQLEEEQQTAGSTWRDLVGSGKAPVLNKLNEFPALGGGETSKSNPVMNLQSLGASIIGKASKKSNQIPWATNNKVPLQSTIDKEKVNLLN